MSEEPPFTRRSKPYPSLTWGHPSCTGPGIITVWLSLGAVLFGADLLDPEAVGRPSVKDGRAVVPTQNSALARSSSPGAGREEHGPGFARRQAASVAASLTGLIQSAGHIIEEQPKVQEKLRELGTMYGNLMLMKKVRMDEFRAGLFCTGCGQTKTEILALGQEFPHKDQSIKKPTPEEIAAEDRKLQEPIDKVQLELAATRDKRDRLEKERTEADEQLNYGIQLWRTAIVFEGLLFGRERDRLDATSRSAIATADAQANSTRIELTKDKSKGNAELQRNAAFWANKVQTLQEGYKNDVQEHQGRVQSSLKTLNAEKERLLSALSEHHTPMKGLVHNTYPSSGNLGDFKMKGGFYRMGDYRPERRGEVLPSVTAFLDALASFRPYVANEPIAGRASPPAPKPSLTSEKQRQLNELLEAGATGLK